jgi:hypothetical protein
MIGYESQKCMHPVHGAAFWGVIRALQSDINICYPPPPVFISLEINEDLPGRVAAALDICLYGGEGRRQLYEHTPRAASCEGGLFSGLQEILN